MNRTILVATDGTPAALGGLRLAKSLAERKGCRIQVMGVVEPVPIFDAGFMVALPEMELYESRKGALKQQILGQVEEVAGRPSAWPVTVRAGVPSQRIVRFAEELGAGTVVMGLGRHGPMDRVFGTETALQVLRISHLPVLAVPEDCGGLPRSALLGVDFSLFSQRAALAAIEVLGTPWEIHLAHVLSGMEFLPTLSEEWRGDYEQELLEQLQGFAGGLQGDSGCETHLHILEGEPAHELLAFAKARALGMLVAGSHGHSFIGRLLMGSVSTRLIRSAQVPVLVVPPEERPEGLLEEEEVRGQVKSWVQDLHEFTKGNAGRRTTLEVEDPELGMQECGRDFPLWGVDYDPRRDRIDIMLGHSGTVEGHLTHSLPAPQDIRVVRGSDGRIEALEVQMKRGKAVLRIHRE